MIIMFWFWILKCDLFVDERGDGEAVEAVRKGLPDLDVVTALAWRKKERALHEKNRAKRNRAHRQHGLTFVIETVDAINRGTLVISSKDEKILWILDLESQQQANCF